MTDLGESVLLPGLINAHCHLDFTRFKGIIRPRQSFTEWIKTINALRRSFTTQDYVDSIGEGFEALVLSGTTTVANIESFPELLPHLPVPPLRTWWFLELIDVRSRVMEDEMLMGALSFFDQHPEWLGGFWVIAACAVHGVGGFIPAGADVRGDAWDAGDDAHRGVGGGARDVQPRERGDA